MTTLVIVTHSGMGDIIIANALVRHFAKTNNVIVPVLQRNVESAIFMFRDCPNVKVILRDNRKWKEPCIRVGAGGPGPWRRDFVLGYYRQHGLNPNLRYEGFHVEPDPSIELQPPPFKFAFAQNYSVPMRIRTALPIVYASHVASRNNIFAYLKILETASEIHVPDSCFLHIVESIPPPASTQLFWHAYAKPTAIPPVTRLRWSIIDPPTGFRQGEDDPTLNT